MELCKVPYFDLFNTNASNYAVTTVAEKKCLKSIDLKADYTNFLEIKDFVSRSGGNSTQLLLDLIDIGDQWNAKSGRADMNFEAWRKIALDSNFRSETPFVKVPGCMATVFLSTKIVYSTPRTIEIEQ